MESTSSAASQNSHHSVQVVENRYDDSRHPYQVLVRPDVVVLQPQVPPDKVESEHHTQHHILSYYLSKLLNLDVLFITFIEMLSKLCIRTCMNTSSGFSPNLVTLAGGSSSS